jgi:uncharacterized glyoxalase superfamily protein PhnB
VSDTFGSSVFYQDPKAALAWLAKAFGFETVMLIEGENGDDSQMHAEMKYGDGLVSIGGEWSEHTRSPRSVGGANTQSLDVRLEEDVDAHCGRARAAGADILQEPRDEFWGDRRYRARDIEGHVWNFSQHVHDVTREEAEAALGHKIEGWTG